MTMVSIRNVSKRLGGKLIVDDLTFEIREGELYGLLGPNGAGKTTTINMLIGSLAPEKGEIVIGAGSPRDEATRRRMGIVPQSVALYETLTGRENLEFFGRLYGLRGEELSRRITYALRVANLEERGRGRVKTFSGGMKRRLNIAAALLHRPSLLILDEPTVGVDPQSRNAIFDCLRAMQKEGCTILLTSHYLEEAQQLCDAVAIMDEGRLVARGSVDEIIASHGGQSILTIETTRGRSRIETSQPVNEIIRINAEEQILSLKMESPNLEKAFLNITGKHLRD
jgi:ABC-2 type transport system ATP-binding protein